MAGEKRASAAATQSRAVMGMQKVVMVGTVEEAREMIKAITEGAAGLMALDRGTTVEVVEARVLTMGETNLVVVMEMITRAVMEALIIIVEAMEVDPT